MFKLSIWISRQSFKRRSSDGDSKVNSVFAIWDFQVLNFRYFSYFYENRLVILIFRKFFGTVLKNIVFLGIQSHCRTPSLLTPLPRHTSAFCRLSIVGINEPPLWPSLLLDGLPDTSLLPTINLVHKKTKKTKKHWYQPNVKQPLRHSTAFLFLGTKILGFCKRIW